MVRPGETVTTEGVADSLIGCNSEGNPVGGSGAREGEAATSTGCCRVDRVEIEVDVAVEVVDVNAAVAVELWDLEVGVRTEEVLERFVEGVEE